MGFQPGGLFPNWDTYVQFFTINNFNQKIGTILPARGMQLLYFSLG